MATDISKHSIPGSSALAALQRAGVDTVVTVPDWIQLALHERLNKQSEGGIRVIPCSNENQVVTVAAGLTIGGKRPLVMMQNQGLYNCFNTLRAVCLDAHIPMVFMVGQFGREFENIGKPSVESSRNMVRLAEPFLHTLGVTYHVLDSEADLPRIEQAFAQAQEQRNAVVLLVSAPMAWR